MLLKLEVNTEPNFSILSLESRIHLVVQNYSVLKDSPMYCLFGIGSEAKPPNQDKQPSRTLSGSNVEKQFFGLQEFEKTQGLREFSQKILLCLKFFLVVGESLRPQYI